ncbi:hypothetical protein Cgig2_023580 [Carnegiea gigantea]|uniref:Uncharacterized protein n=1 Tax=Carnegiea gigantea TaxID=171969 RepID=A0A9Q1JQN7_9CARY|nr:hypothetical protein Cgig2_023580 [Carnegiea gigantea]
MGNEWRFIGLYRFPETQNKLKTCDLIGDLWQHSDLPSLVGGDLHEILYDFKKNGGSMKWQSVLEEFRTMLADCDLYNLGYWGRKYTWWNRKEGNGFVEEIFDRFYAQSGWSVLFPAANAFHINSNFLNHLLILLKCFEPRQARRRVRRKRFENMRALNDPCEHMMIRGWEQNTSANVVEEWNKQEFGYVSIELQKCEEELKGVISPGRRKKLLANMSDWPKKEEILWWQRSHVDYLKYSDWNTGWFHQRANGRRSTNLIKGLLGANDIADLIDHDSGRSRNDMIDNILLPMDGEIPRDRIIWHYANDSKYSVRSSYRMIRELKARMVSSPSAATITALWKNHVKRAKKRVVHTLAHLQPYNYSDRIWLNESSDCILNLVANDLCNAFAN